MASTPLTGGCGCGAVRFELAQPPVRAVYCHCTRCQRRTGTSASASAVVAPGSVRVTQGEDRVRGWTPEGGRTKAFCGDCGSAGFIPKTADGTIAGVRLGAFDADPRVRPSARQFTAYAAVWEPIPEDGLPR